MIVPDPLCTVDRERLVKRLGVLPEPTFLALLQEMFAVWESRSASSQARPGLLSPAATD